MDWLQNRTGVVLVFTLAVVSVFGFCGTALAMPPELSATLSLRSISQYSNSAFSSSHMNGISPAPTPKAPSVVQHVAAIAFPYPAPKPKPKPKIAARPTVRARLSTRRTTVPFAVSHSLLSEMCPDSSLPIDAVYASPLQQIVREAATTYEVDAALLYSMIVVESRCNADATSPVGAMGLMQLMPGTARWLGVKDPFHIRDNVFGGAKYLAYLKQRFEGDTFSALAAYNAGPGNVLRYGGIPPFRETVHYVRRVLQLRNRFSSLASTELPAS